MSRLGGIGEFHPDQESWLSYTERLDCFFAATDQHDEVKRRALLLASAGSQTYQLIRNLCRPQRPTEKSYDNIVQMMTDHYIPRRSEIVHRFKFNNRSRQQGETIATFVAELRKLSEFCDYHDMLDQMLRDRLVCSINNPSIQRRLLGEPDLTLKTALNIAQGMEAAEASSKTMEEDSAVVYSLASSKEETRTQSSICYRCDGQHQPQDCRFKEVTCHHCKRKGHIARACRSRKKQFVEGNVPQRRVSRTNQVVEVQEGDGGMHQADEYPLFNVVFGKSEPIMARVKLNGIETQMEIDTGAAVSLVNPQVFHSFANHRSEIKLIPTTVKLRSYSGHEVKVNGECKVVVEYKGKHKCLPLLVVDGQGPSLFGRNWLSSFQLNGTENIKLIVDETKIDSLMVKYAEIFQNDLGKLKDVTAKIHVDSEATPIFCRARHKIEKELDRLEKEEIIEHTQFSEWSSPIVPVMKSNGSLCICGDYKSTVNKVSKLDTYPLSRIEDILASLSGGQLFTKLDLSHAYNQVELNPDSQKYLAINTHKGLYIYKRLPFGIKSAPAIFQRLMENLLQGLPQVAVYIDDIIITGKTEVDHMTNLEEVLKRLQNAGMRLKKENCICCFQS